MSVPLSVLGAPGTCGSVSVIRLGKFRGTGSVARSVPFSFLLSVFPLPVGHAYPGCLTPDILFCPVSVLFAVLTSGPVSCSVLGLTGPPGCTHSAAVSSLGACLFIQNDISRSRSFILVGSCTWLSLILVGSCAWVSLYRQHFYILI